MFERVREDAARQRPWERERRLALRLVVLLVVLGALMTQVAVGTPGARGPHVVVRPGQTLWGIATSRYPQADPRQAIAAIEAANHLHGAVIVPGERLLLPPV